ncbi:Uncharacterized protein TCM_025447 [Theobroma cacao]|uniref:KIB1-4 beta-propeller domain-containing protein n=1 Tax=Theobroma cacao TaxID=3641 RepID=A0A061F6B4_THECC|nr:Uncharacterized protein TCM_025447 [Theobroma cacao]
MAKEATTEEERQSYSLPPCISQPYPWLVISHGKYNQRQTFFSVSQHRYYTKIIPEMRNKLICGSSFGWLVLVDRVSPNCFLLNLSSMETIQLPPLNFKLAIGILTAPPSDPNCRILLIDGNHDFIFCSPGDSEFSKQKVEDFLYSMTTLGGKIYCLTLPEYSLLTMEFEGSSLRFTKLNTIRNESNIFHIEDNRSYLIEFFGEMLLVCKYLSLKSFEWTHDIGVFKFDFCGREWVEVKSIGDNAIFLTDDFYGTCYPVVDSITRNSIYYTYSEDKNLYVYDLEDQSITTHLPCPIVSRPCSLHYWCMLSTANTS